MYENNVVQYVEYAEIVCDAGEKQILLSFQSIDNPFAIGLFHAKSAGTSRVLDLKRNLSVP